MTGEDEIKLTIFFGLSIGGITLNMILFCICFCKQTKDNKSSLIPKIFMYSFLVQIGFNFIGIQNYCFYAYEKIIIFAKWFLGLFPYLSQNIDYLLVLQGLFDICLCLFIIIETCYCWESLQLFKNPIVNYSFRRKLYISFGLCLIFISLLFLTLGYFLTLDNVRSLIFIITRCLIFCTFIIYLIIASLSMIGILLSLCVKSPFIKGTRKLFWIKYLFFCGFLIIAFNIPLVMIYFEYNKIIIANSLTILGICLSLFRFFDFGYYSFDCKKKRAPRSRQIDSETIEYVNNNQDNELIVNNDNNDDNNDKVEVSTLEKIQSNFVSDCFTYLIQAICHANTLTDYLHLKPEDLEKEYSFIIVHIFSVDETITIETKDATIESFGESIRAKINIFSNKIEIFDHAPRVFFEIRKIAGITPEMIMESFNLDSNSEQLSKYSNSEGKSGSLFFLTFDKKFLIKTISQTELNTFLKNFLQSYHEHLGENNTSLLAKTYGLYTLVIGIAKIHFIIMENLTPFDLNMRNSSKFDLKGSSVGRQINDFIPNRTQQVMKDKNLCYLMKEKKISMLLNQKDQFNINKWLESDSMLLYSHNIMDYSLYLVIVKKGIDLLHVQPHRIIYSTDKQYIYILGIIDYLTIYDQKKSCENCIMQLLNFSKRNEISAVDPEYYQKRFTIFLSNILNNKQMT